MAKIAFVRARGLVWLLTAVVRHRSFKVDEPMVTRVTGVLENPFPLRRSMKRATGELPVHQVNLFSFVAVCLHNDEFGATSDAFNLLERSPQIVNVAVVQGCNRDNQVKR